MKLYKLLAAAGVALILASCATPKNYNYLQDLQNGQQITTPTDGTIRLQPNDMITVLVKSKNTEMANVFNKGLITNVKAGLAEVGICTGSFYGNIGSFFGDICSFTNAFMLPAAGSVGAVSSFYGGQTAIGFISGNLPGSGINMGSYAALVSGQALNVSSGSSFTAFFNSFFRAGLSAYGSGSLYIGSYNISSFNTFFVKYGSYKGFYAGSFGLSILSGLTAGSGISGSGGNYGQIGGFFAEDSIYRSADGIVITAEEYHRTLINLSSCPLNAYGYGINLI